MSQWLYRIQPTRPAMLTEGPTPEEADAVSRHFERLKDLTEKGVMILAGRTLNTDVSSFGICILRRKMNRRRERSWSLTRLWSQG